ncbi:MAG: penicillin-binding transpeptidase domain-containing protein [Lachnospiraceae bacterium]|nr:penicillin-binding transpeptidase domain-containing protein [Lachnospiraceae bacterium]
MRKRNRRKRRKKPNRLRWTAIALIGLAGIAAAIYLYGACFFAEKAEADSPEELLLQYMEHISRGEYEEMYEMLDVELSGGISQEDFVKRNAAIYEGIEAENITVKILEWREREQVVVYDISFDTAAGPVHFKNEAWFQKTKAGDKLVWEDSLIFPELCAEDKVKVSVIQAERGEILDRNGRVLAGKGTASAVGIVPGKLEDKEAAIQEIADILQIEPKTIEKKLAQQWVKDDSFVPIQTVPKLKEAELMALEQEEGLEEEKERQEKLLAVPGVLLSDTQVREYPLKEAASHLIGYVQQVTAEDLKEHEGEGYTAGSVIGRSGVEGLFEKELKGQNVRLTIDADLQAHIYEQFQSDKSCSAAVNPDTGEVLALVSTPSYDNNDFIMGFSSGQWNALSEDENKPMYNRFQQVWCPGSVLKPVIAAAGLESGAVNPAKDYGKEGLSWQKDASWGAYHVTTLHAYEPVTLENALIYSDNIYFAKAALKIGREELEASLSRLGFGEELPFEIKMQKSQYSNTEKIETEIQLADSGYGQGQILVNPLHLACIYSAFCNEGNIKKPYLLFTQENASEDWISGAFSRETADIVLEGMKKVVNDANGTGYGAHREDVLLAGKTGTAEIKTSKEDTSGTELGWFAIFTAEKTAERPILLVSMTEDVKERGGSGYAVEKASLILEQWLAGN